MNHNDIQWLTERLPPIEPTVLRSEPDYYGASHEIAIQLGRAKAPRSFATWRHGWVYQPIAHVRQLVPWGSAKERHLVATEAHVQTLKAFGFERAVAVGLPFIYAPDSKVLRQPNTLLVMPSHSLPYTSHTWDEHSYVAAIAQLKDQFSQIVACVHSSCLIKGTWITEFDRYGIPWIVGATVEDRNALHRMATIFRSFETMTTNAIGSHLPYAAYAGCKLSIYGPFAEFSEKDFEKDPWYSQYPDLLKHVILHGRESAIRQQCPQFFVHPENAVTHEEWGKAVLGDSYRRNSKAIAQFLGWSPAEQIAGHLRRTAKALQRKMSRRGGA
ncbi:MAG: hypothetical protein H0T73_21385 [Ardenticatenales bacterium]|nr:hypothetical protein [Ardenticatenales bacterium]